MKENKTRMHTENKKKTADKYLYISIKGRFIIVFLYEQSLYGQILL